MTLTRLEGAFLNDTEMPLTHNYNDPAVVLKTNGVADPTSQRFHVRSIQAKRFLKLSQPMAGQDICTPFDVDIPVQPMIPLS